MESLVKVEGLSVKFCRDLKRSLKYGLYDLAKELAGFGGNRSELRPYEFWALKDLNFELNRGECLGLVGPNGAGKSTLLKLINGLFKPDEGQVSLYGRVGALIELGTGFNPVLTGRENVYINGSVLGLTNQEIDRKFDRIVEFSEIGPFIDSPVSSYSSGMALRLAFSVAVQMEVDILLLDEVLAVGDVGFRAKCFGAMQNLLDRAAVIFVSHSMPQIARLSTKLVVLNQGRSVYYGENVPQGIDQYYAQFDSTPAIVVGPGRVEIQQVILSSNKQATRTDGILQLNYLDPMTIRVRVKLSEPTNGLGLSVLFYDRETRGVAQASSQAGQLNVASSSQQAELCVDLPQVPFNPGRYTLSLTLLEEATGQVLTTHHNSAEFQVYGLFFGFTPVQLEAVFRVEQKTR